MIRLLLLLLFVPLYADYTTIVPLEKSTEYDEVKVFSKALEQVLIQLTGNRFVVTIPSISQAFVDVKRWVNSFEQVAVDNQVALEVSFDRSEINNLLKEKHLRIWVEGNRPHTLLMTSEKNSIHELLHLSKLRGLPVVLGERPAQSLDEEAIRVLSLTQKFDYILWSESEQVWLLYDNDGLLDRSFNIENNEDLVDQLMSYYVEYSSVLLGDQGQMLRVMLKNISDFEQYQRILRQIRDNKFINHVIIESIALDQIVLQFDLSVSRDVLQRWWLGLGDWSLCSSDENLCFIRQES